MQDLRAKVIISKCFLIAAMEQTNKTGRTYISAKALSMDLRKSAVGEIVAQTSSSYVLIYFHAVYLLSSSVKQKTEKYDVR